MFIFNSFWKKKNLFGYDSNGMKIKKNPEYQDSFYSSSI